MAKSVIQLRSLQIPYYLHYEPGHIAAALLYLSAQMMKLDTRSDTAGHWWQLQPLACPIDVLEGKQSQKPDFPNSPISSRLQCAEWLIDWLNYANKCQKLQAKLT